MSRSRRKVLLKKDIFTNFRDYRGRYKQNFLSIDEDDFIYREKDVKWPRSAEKWGFPWRKHHRVCAYPKNACQGELDAAIKQTQRWIDWYERVNAWISRK